MTASQGAGTIKAIVELHRPALGLAKYPCLPRIMSPTIALGRRSLEPDPDLAGPARYRYWEGEEVGPDQVRQNQFGQVVGCDDVELVSRPRRVPSSRCHPVDRTTDSS